MSDVTAGPGRRKPGRPSAGARDAILAAALDLIGEQGLGQLTTREVGRRAGVSEASVFYHFQDKVGLVQAVVLAGLAPLKALDVSVVAGQADRPLADTLLRLATALEAFFDNAMPVLATVQSDAALRNAFADRLVKGDLGPHRGVQLLARYLTGMAENGLVDPDVDKDATALLVIGACFLRSWLRQLAGPRRKQTLPSLPETLQAVAKLLAPPDAGP